MALVIEYDQAYEILHRHRGIALSERNPEAEELFGAVVLSFFSTHGFEDNGENHSRHYQHLLEENNLLNFEYSEVGSHIIEAIMDTTRLYLPGYAAHNQQHIARVFRARMHARSTLLLELDALQVDLFFSPKRGFWGA
jgi:hypothetical protein